METLAKKIAKSVGESLGKSEEEVAVMAYGLIGILQFSAIFILSSVIGCIFGFWLEVVIVFLSVGFLRRLMGGAHSSGLYNCLVYSVLFVCGFSAIAFYAFPRVPLTACLLLCVAIFLFGYVMIALKAPVTPPNKPCRTEAKRKRLRKGAFIVLTVFMVLVAISFLLRTVWYRFFTLGMALSLSCLWQITMMTKFGHLFISFIDGMFIKSK